MKAQNIPGDGHKHESSIIGPYCYFCHIDLVGPYYDHWADEPAPKRLPVIMVECPACHDIHYHLGGIDQSRGVSR